MISCEFTVVILISGHVEWSYIRIIKTAKQSNRIFKKEKQTKKNTKKKTNKKTNKKSTKAEKT